LIAGQSSDEPSSSTDLENAFAWGDDRPEFRRFTVYIEATRTGALLLSLVAAASAGCGQAGVNLSAPGQAAFAQPQQALATQYQELQTRASALDRDNQELESLLAQSRQQIHLLQDELTVVRDQLGTANRQLAQSREEKQGLEQQTEALVASMQRRSVASIQPNNSLVGGLDLSDLPGVHVRQDGDVIRVELAGDALFRPSETGLTTQGMQLVETVVVRLTEKYPNQVFGIEGHTDSDPIRTQQHPTGHHFATARATAVYDHLRSSLRIPPEQLIVVGHGGNHPVVSNATAAGRARNRRVELVVYPESFR